MNKYYCAEDIKAYCESKVKYIRGSIERLRFLGNKYYYDTTGMIKNAKNKLAVYEGIVKEFEENIPTIDIAYRKVEHESMKGVEE